ncbi:MAG: hypothetical protein ACYC33_12100 [Thermoleophilia bacterium]
MLARIALWAVLTVVLHSLVPWAPGVDSIEVDAFLGFALGLVPVLLISWTLVRGLLPGAVLGALVVGCVVVSGILSREGWFLLAVPFKVVVAAGGGVLLGRQVAEAWWLAVVAAVAVVADTWSVFAGPTKVVVEKAPAVLDYLLIHFPVLGAPGPGMGLGISDVIFLSLFTAGSVGAGLRAVAGFTAMAASFLVTVAVALVWKPALPALPFLALAFLAVNTSRFVALARSARGTGGRST